jgi:hypothetical protein
MTQDEVRQCNELADKVYAQIGQYSEVELSGTGANLVLLMVVKRLASNIESDVLDGDEYSADWPRIIHATGGLSSFMLGLNASVIAAFAEKSN